MGEEKSKKATGSGTETTSQKAAEKGKELTLSNVIKSALKEVPATVVIDILQMLWQQCFKPSDETKLKSEEIGLTFEHSEERKRCQGFREIPIDEFKEFAEDLAKKFDLSYDVKYSLLKGSLSAENTVIEEDFQTRDGKGEIRLVRFVTMNRDGKIDIAYAIYTQSFELVKNETWFIKWWYVVPIGWKYRKVAQKLSEKQKDMFMQRCEQKLSEHVAQKCSKELNMKR